MNTRRKTSGGTRPSLVTGCSGTPVHERAPPGTPRGAKNARQRNGPPSVPATSPRRPLARLPPVQDLSTAQRLAAGATVSRVGGSAEVPGNVVRVEKRAGDEPEPLELRMGAGFARSVRSAGDDELPLRHWPSSKDPENMIFSLYSARNSAGRELMSCVITSFSRFISCSTS